MTMTDTQMPTRGDRIELVRTSDEYTLLRPGSTGFVERVTRHPSGPSVVSVKWDDGSGLMLLEGVDEWRVIPKLKAVE